MPMAAVGYSMALSRAEVLVSGADDPAAAHRAAARAWRRVPDMQFVAVVSGVTPGDVATIQDADTAATAHELPGGAVSRYMVIGVSMRSGETVALEVWARNGLAALGRAQFAGAGLPRVHLVAALGGAAARLELTLESLPGRRVATALAIP